MSSSVGVLDFFIVEANEYIERLDQLLAAAGSSGPDVDALHHCARTLRGSATMSRQHGIAGVAAALERVMRAFRARSLRWDAATAAIVTGAVDDLRILLRGVRGWGPNEDRRAAARTAELERLAPASATPSTPAAARPSGNGFLGAETSELARAIEHFLDAPADPAALAAVSERVRALRGIAGLRDLAPLPEVLEAVEQTVKRLELGDRAPAGPKRTALLSASAAVLRRASRDIAARGRPDAGLMELIPFNAAVVALADDEGTGDRIVPIAQLFHDDDGPHLVQASPNPPTTPTERFRLEVVSLAEHLRLVAAEARAQRDDHHRDRIAREMRNALRALASAANSFGEQLVARFAGEWSERTATLDERALSAIDTAAALLANPATRTEQVQEALERLAPDRAGAPARDAHDARPRPAVPPAAPADHTAVAPPREPLRTPTGAALREYLQTGIAGFDELERRPLSQPTPVPGEEVVPIESLLYRGRAALERAAELRAEILRGGAAPSRDAVQELFDLIDLALVE
ncbi:MAG TPA: Hpt domain-containing protein [Gemmatimonadaceae bacterium]|nr:Hpt domain-containing protein [Gemmatimonadaceae bacterium]